MQEHDSYPLTDFIEYPQDEMLARSQAFLEDMKRRHSIRSFSDKPVPKEIIENCIKTAGRAPNGANHQPWHFVAISDPEIKKQVREQAELHERGFYEGRAGEEWLDALKPLGNRCTKALLGNRAVVNCYFQSEKRRYKR